jgi:hypothetical protein
MENFGVSSRNDGILVHGAEGMIKAEECCGLVFVK